jgi:ribosomal protein S18 acetylase RimI-like enzyme
MFSDIPPDAYSIVTHSSPPRCEPGRTRPAPPAGLVSDRTGAVKSDPVRIRRYQPGDLDDLYRICLRTADDGQDATPLFRDPRLPGHIYAGPYAAFEPSLAFVAEDSGGVGGYTLGALDTRAFEQRLERDWWPALRVSHPEPDPGEDVSQPEWYAIHHIHHPWTAANDLADRFPSHLHIDLLPRLQGHGIGRQLIATLTAALREQNSPGVHLLVGRANQNAAGFYRHLGFTELPAGDALIFTMDLTGRPG